MSISEEQIEYKKLYDWQTVQGAFGCRILTRPADKEEAREHIQGIKEAFIKDWTKPLSPAQDIAAGQIENIVEGAFTDNEITFIELIQNAADAATADGSKISFEFTPEELVVRNDARLFTKSDVKAVTRPGQSNKAGDAIGYWGVGFMSVYQLTESPHIVSPPYQFRFANKDYGLDVSEPVWTVIPDWVNDDALPVDYDFDENTFILPYRDNIRKQSLNPENSQNDSLLDVAMSEINASLLLFIPDIRAIEVVNKIDDEGLESRYEQRQKRLEILDEQRFDDHASIQRTSDGQEWFVYRLTYDIPEQIQRDLESSRCHVDFDGVENPQREIVIAFNTRTGDLQPLRAVDESESKSGGVYAQIYSFFQEL